MQPSQPTTSRPPHMSEDSLPLDVSPQRTGSFPSNAASRRPFVRPQLASSLPIGFLTGRGMLALSGQAPHDHNSAAPFNGGSSATASSMSGIPTSSTTSVASDGINGAPARRPAPLNCSRNVEWGQPLSSSSSAALAKRPANHNHPTNTRLQLGGSLGRSDDDVVLDSAASPVAGSSWGISGASSSAGSAASGMGNLNPSHTSTATSAQAVLLSSWLPPPTISSGSVGSGAFLPEVTAPSSSAASSRLLPHPSSAAPAPSPPSDIHSNAQRPVSRGRQPVSARSSGPSVPRFTSRSSRPRNELNSTTTHSGVGVSDVPPGTSLADFFRQQQQQQDLGATTPQYHPHISAGSGQGAKEVLSSSFMPAAEAFSLVHHPHHKRPTDPKHQQQQQQPLQRPATVSRGALPLPAETNAELVDLLATTGSNSNSNLQRPFTSAPPTGAGPPTATHPTIISSSPLALSSSGNHTATAGMNRATSSAASAAALQQHHVVVADDATVVLPIGGGSMLTPLSTARHTPTTITTPLLPSATSSNTTNSNNKPVRRISGDSVPVSAMLPSSSMSAHKGASVLGHSSSSALVPVLSIGDLTAVSSGFVVGGGAASGIGYAEVDGLLLSSPSCSVDAIVASSSMRPQVRQKEPCLNLDLFDDGDDGTANSQETTSMHTAGEKGNLSNTSTGGMSNVGGAGDGWATVSTLPTSTGKKKKNKNSGKTPAPSASSATQQPTQHPQQLWVECNRIDSNATPISLPSSPPAAAGSQQGSSLRTPAHAFHRSNGIRVASPDRTTSTAPSACGSGASTPLGAELGDESSVGRTESALGSTTRSSAAPTTVLHAAAVPSPKKEVTAAPSNSAASIGGGTLHNSTNSNPPTSIRLVNNGLGPVAVEVGDDRDRGLGRGGGGTQSSARRRAPQQTVASLDEFADPFPMRKGKAKIPIIVEEVWDGEWALPTHQQPVPSMSLPLSWPPQNCDSSVPPQQPPPLSPLVGGGSGLHSSSNGGHSATQTPTHNLHPVPPSSGPTSVSSLRKAAVSASTAFSRSHVVSPQPELGGVNSIETLRKGSSGSSGLNAVPAAAGSSARPRRTSSKAPGDA